MLDVCIERLSRLESGRVSDRGVTDEVEYHDGTHFSLVSRSFRVSPSQKEGRGKVSSWSDEDHCAPERVDDFRVFFGLDPRQTIKNHASMTSWKPDAREPRLQLWYVT